MIQPATCNVVDTSGWLEYRRGRIVDLDHVTALEAGRCGLTYKLPLADSVIYAAAQVHGAMLWTQDAHFDGLPAVQYHAKKTSGL